MSQNPEQPACWVAALQLDHSAHGYGDIDAQIAIVCKQLGNGGVKHQAVGVHDGRADSLMDRSETISGFNQYLKTVQKLRMLSVSSATLNFQFTKIVMNSGFQSP